MDPDQTASLGFIVFASIIKSTLKYMQHTFSVQKYWQ